MPVTEAPISHIVIDEEGRALIRGTTCKVIELAQYHRFWKMDATSLHANLPHLSFAQIHAALSYYYDHQSELDCEMEREVERADRLLRERVENSVTREKLLAARRTRRQFRAETA